jgi:type I restriction enzyme M protein
MAKTEDVVRREAQNLLRFYPAKGCQCDVGQITTFNLLGFKGVIDKPDGWYLPDNTTEVAIVLETKSSDKNLEDERWKSELFKNIDIVATKYDKVIGILYNGVDVLVYKDKQLVDLKKQLFTKEYYLNLYNKNTLDKGLIFKLTEQINNNLHKNFGVNNLYHRMIFTACALVAQRYDKNCLREGMNWATLHASILSTIKNSYATAKQQNQKLDLIAEQFTLIQCNYTENQTAINDFIKDINDISSSINSDYWNGEDVMAIFFNEFTRYKGKSEQGQVFTPDHITSLIYRITGTTFKDNVLDACCGSGSFLVKAMSYMISEVGGVNNEEAVRKIKEERLYGVEFSKELYALACANMLIHKDGKTNLTQDDSRTSEVGAWIKSKKITKVLMNPPYENAYGCLNIVKNVLDNVEDGAICAFILPDNKLEVAKQTVLLWLNTHSIQTIVKLPDVFSGMAGVATSIFIFKAHEPQNNREIFSCWIENDGLEIVKNKGRLDVYNRWQDIENNWVETIYKRSGDESIQWIKPAERLMYRLPEKKIHLFDNDFKKNVLDYILFENRSEFESYDGVLQLLSMLKVKSRSQLDICDWQEFTLGGENGLFGVSGSKTTKKGELENSGYGPYPYITTKAIENGVSGFFNIKTERGNCLTVDSAVLGTCFYQESDFSASDHVEVLRPKYADFNRSHGLFIKSCIDAFKGDNYNYGFKFNQRRISETVIKLPAKEVNGEYIPDWDFMNDFIASIYEEISKKIFSDTEEVLDSESNQESSPARRFRP